MIPSGVLARVVLFAAYGAVGVAGAVLLSEFTVVGADLGTYQRAGADLLAHGDPYASSAAYGPEFQYRYPPLLAMLMPILGWPPVWYAILAVATAIPIWLAYRDGGVLGLLLPLLFTGAWLMTLFNGNVQPVLIALLCLTPRFARAGPVMLAVATMLKIHPALALIWYVGRRDWRALRWYAAGMLVLVAIQAPWLGLFVDYYLNDPASQAAGGASLILAGTVPWAVGVGVAGVVAYRYANTRYGWLLAQVLQLVFLPRLFLWNFALVLAAPLPPREDRAGAGIREASALRRARLSGG